MIPASFPRRDSPGIRLAGWLGVACLSASWLPGLGYYHPADWRPWAALLAVGVLLLTALPRVRAAEGRMAWLAGLLALPAVVVAPWPWRAAVLLLAAGCLLPRLARRLSGLQIAWDRLRGALLAAGLLLIVQAVTLHAYVGLTSRSHELPPPLPHVLGLVAASLGIESAVQGNTLALHSMRQVHHLGATWELFLDPVTLCFLASVPVVAWLAAPRSQPPAWNRRLARIGLPLLLVVALWLPLRAGLWMAWFLHDVLRTPYEAELDAMSWFWSTPMHLALLALPVLILSLRGPALGPALGTTAGDPPAPSASAPGRPPHRWSPRHGSPRHGSPRHGSPRYWLARRWLASGWLPPLLAGLSCLSVTWGLLWEPVGVRQPGRVLIEEHHPDPAKIWEPTGRPYDTEWYGQPSGYNYACLYDYLSRFYRVSRWTEPLSEEPLRRCDVLVLKVPTRRYSEREIDVVERFVERGGGLLLIGEHTNVYRTSDHLNPVAERFGLRFREDCLFGIDQVFEQAFRPPLVPHPIVQSIETLDFATSCSLAPGWASGRAPIRSLGLKNKLADYHADNYYPQPSDDAAMRYGAFVQLWAMRRGQGRVVAFTDSTIFSNFCLFDPGKSELMLGMIEWLNHRGGWRYAPPVSVGAGLLLAVVSVGLAVRRGTPWLSLLAAALLGWSAAVAAVRLAHQVQMPPPAPRRDFVRVVLDRTLCRGPLSKNGFVDASGEGFGVFAQWILRLGYFTSRQDDNPFRDADLVLLLAPDREPEAAFRQQLDRYLRAGGVVALVDTARDESTSRSILAAYGLSLEGDKPLRGTLKGPADWPGVPLDQSLEVRGGEPLAWVGQRVVAARQRVGAGSLVVIGFGWRFQDARMGYNLDVQPDRELRQVFELQYALLRWLVEQNRREGGTGPLEVRRAV